MSSIERFEDIESWQKARVLTSRIYGITKQPEFWKDFGLRDQVRRASVSIMSNIAEGFDRNNDKEFVHFLSISKSSASELKSHLYVALDQNYIGSQLFNETYELAHSISKMNHGLMAYLKESDLRGIKFKNRS